MKAITCILLLACLSHLARAEETANLEVHEWGTFTVVSGSDGAPLKWFQPWRVLDEVPDFVGVNPFGSKGAFPFSLVRMETPVLYFYPQAKMAVQVQARMESGRITEWFPKPRLSFDGSITALSPIQWEGELLPPSDREAQARIPEVPSGKGAHYRHAREVPDAWIFHSTAPPMQGDTSTKDADKFIFYRGTGDSPPPYRALALPDDTLRIVHSGEGDAVEAAFAIIVSDGSARWARLPKLPATKPGDSGNVSLCANVRLDSPALPVARAESELAAAMRDALIAADLTSAEASAMVATWTSHWFREPGARVLAILPRAWVDSVLPLTITPTPQKLTRVFVARFEVLMPERESALLALLNGSATDKASVPDTDGFRRLQLGRFANGALLRAQNMQSERMREQFAKLQEAIAQSATTAAR